MSTTWCITRCIGCEISNSQPFPTISSWPLIHTTRVHDRTQHQTTLHGLKVPESIVCALFDTLFAVVSCVEKAQSCATKYPIVCHIMPWPPE